MKKIIFTTNIHSIVDVITNSSSELFVGHSDSKGELANLLKGIYPDYLDEYQELQHSSELTNEELDNYISYKYHTWSNEKQVMENKLIPGFTFEEMYEENEGSDWDRYKMIKNNKWDFVFDGNRERVLAGIDPNNSMYFLWSKDENPNWEMQEAIWEVMERYHLG